MPAPTLIVEDGSVVADANSYVDLEYAENYHEAVLWATKWGDSDPETKTRALIMATRMIDGGFKFYGFKTNDANPLEWPRMYAQNSESAGTAYYVGGSVSGNYYRSNEVPDRLKKATAELAGQLVAKNRTAEWSALGIKSVGLGQGAVDVSFMDNAAEVAAMPFTPTVLDFLSPLGYPRSGSSRAIVRRG